MDNENANMDQDDFIFNEYAIDDTLDPLERLVRYHTSDFSLQRLVLIRELSDTAAFAGFAKTQTELVPLLRNFVQDSEPTVRHVFVQQLTPLAQYMVNAGGADGYQEFLQTLLPFGVELLVDKNVEVGSAALESMKSLAALVKDEHVDQHLLQVLLTLARDERAEDYRMVAAQLFDELSEKLGKPLCESAALPEIKLLANDLCFSVRRTVAFSLSNIATVLGNEVADREIFPLYANLCKDEVWGVRKACAESIVGVSRAVSPECRLQLVGIFKALSEDATRWVRVAAYQQLGQFIHTMRSEDVNSMFLKIFTDMAFQSEGGDCDFAEYCAFSFPAVVQVMGPSRWKELDDAYATLLKDVQWKVRRSLAHSLHEVGKIVGTDVAEKSLVSALELFLRDLDEVKVGVISNIDEFLKVLTPATRANVVPVLCQVPIDNENWRLRNAVAGKLGHIVDLVQPAVVGEHIADIVLRLLDDSVMDVRNSSYYSAAAVLARLHSAGAEGQKWYAEYRQAILSMSSRPSYQVRQMYLYICQQLLEMTSSDSAKQLAEEMLDDLCNLCKDRVSNVRFIAARVLANSAFNNDVWRDNPKIQAAKASLLQDSEADIVALAHAQLPRLADPSKTALYRPG